LYSTLIFYLFIYLFIYFAAIEVGYG